MASLRSAYAEYEEAYGAQPGPLDYSQPTGFEMASGYEELYPNDFSTVPGFQTNSFDDCANYGGQSAAPAWRFAELCIILSTQAVTVHCKEHGGECSRNSEHARETWDLR